MSVKDQESVCRDLNISIIHVLPYLTSLMLKEKIVSDEASAVFCFEAKQLSDEEVTALKEPEQFLFNFYNSSCSILNKLAHGKKCQLSAIEIYGRDLEKFVQTYSGLDDSYLKSIENNVIEYRAYFRS